MTERVRTPRPRLFLRFVGLILAFSLTIVAVWLIALGNSQQQLRLGVISGLWGALVAGMTFFGGRHSAAAPNAAANTDVELRQNFALELQREVSARRAYEQQLHEMVRREIETIQRVVGDQLGRLREDVATLRGDLVDQVGGKIRLERIETTRVIGSDIEALQNEVRQLAGARISGSGSGDQSRRVLDATAPEVVLGANGPTVRQPVANAPAAPPAPGSIRTADPNDSTNRVPDLVPAATPFASASPLADLLAPSPVRLSTNGGTPAQPPIGPQPADAAWSTPTFAMPSQPVSQSVSQPVSAPVAQPQSVSAPKPMPAPQSQPLPNLAPPIFAPPLPAYQPPPPPAAAYEQAPPVPAYAQAPPAPAYEPPAVAIYEPPPAYEPAPAAPTNGTSLGHDPFAGLPRLSRFDDIDDVHDVTDQPGPTTAPDPTPVDWATSAPVAVNGTSRHANADVSEARTNEPEHAGGRRRRADGDDNDVLARLLGNR